MRTLATTPAHRPIPASPKENAVKLTRRGRIAGVAAAAALTTVLGAGAAATHASHTSQEDIDLRLGHDPKLHVGALDGDYPDRVLTRAYGNKLPSGVASALLRYLNGIEKPDANGHKQLMLSQDLALPVDKDAPFIRPYDQLYKDQVRHDQELATRVDG